MINLDNITNNNNEKQNEKWPYIPDHPYRILIIGGSGSAKTNTLLNLINKQRDIEKIYLHAKDLSEPKYEYLIKIRENAGIKHLTLVTLGRGQTGPRHWFFARCTLTGRAIGLKFYDFSSNSIPGQKCN